jgi:hypothetical protein
MKRKMLLTAAAAAVLAAAAAALCLYLDGFFLPGWIEWKDGNIPVSGEETLVLEGRTAKLAKAGAVLWRQDAGVRTQDALVCDLDRDGQKELLLLCWKRGRYGKSRPFWVTRDEITWSQHIFIYKLTAAGAKPVWMASDIGLDAASWTFGEKARLVITDKKGKKTAWDWLSWGLTNIDR